MRTPRMEFSDCYPGQLDDFRYCDFCAERNGGVPLCAAVCPSGALQLPVDYAPETEVIGVAVLNTETCIAYRSSFCAFCHDVCIQVRGEENAAIYYQNADAADALDTRLPVVDAEKCNGCGACEAVCVSALLPAWPREPGADSGRTTSRFCARWARCYPWWRPRPSSRVRC